MAGHELHRKLGLCCCCSGGGFCKLDHGYRSSGGGPCSVGDHFPPLHDPLTRTRIGVGVATGDEVERKEAAEVGDVDAGTHLNRGEGKTYFDGLDRKYLTRRNSIIPISIGMTKVPILYPPWRTMTKVTATIISSSINHPIKRSLFPSDVDAGANCALILTPLPPCALRKA